MVISLYLAMYVHLSLSCRDLISVFLLLRGFFFFQPGQSGRLAGGSKMHLASAPLYVYIYIPSSDYEIRISIPRWPEFARHS